MTSDEIRSFERLNGPVEAANLLVESAETRRPALRRAEYWENNVAMSEVIRAVE